MCEKARVAQRVHEARGMSTAKALRRALARTADDLWGLALVCTDVQIEALDQDGVIDALSDDALMLVLDGPDGASGLAMIDRAALTAITEIQTIQTVTTLPVDPRPLTHTDAAMVAPMLDDTMARFALNLDDNPLRPQIEGFRFGAMVEDRRSATLLLDAAEYRTYHTQMDLAAGARAGRLSLFLPDRVLPKAEDAEDAVETRRQVDAFLSVPARLECVLARVRLPIAKAETLKPGDILPLQANTLDGVEVIAKGGGAIAGGRLGQLNGARAIRLTWPERGEAAAMAAGAAMAAPADAALSDGMAAEAFGAADAHGPAFDAAAIDPPGDNDLPALRTEASDDTEDALPDLPPMEPAEDADPLAAFGGSNPGAGEDTPDFSPGMADFDFDIDE